MNSKSVKRIKRKTAYWLLSFISYLMPTQVILGTVHERRFSGSSEEEGCMLTLSKGISLKWMCERECLSSNLNTRNILFALIIPSPRDFTLKSVQIIQASL